MVLGTRPSGTWYCPLGTAVHFTCHHPPSTVRYHMKNLERRQKPFFCPYTNIHCLTRHPGKHFIYFEYKVIGKDIDFQDFGTRKVLIFMILVQFWCKERYRFSHFWHKAIWFRGPILYVSIVNIAINIARTFIALYGLQTWFVPQFKFQ